MNQEALHILQRLTTDSSLRQKRLTDLLKPAEAAYAEGWFMCVRKCFNDALDIRPTERIVDGKKSLVWTQGSAFSFNVGDTLYDTQDAYQEWGKALKTFSHCVQVIRSLPAGPASEGSGRSSGSVTIEVFKPNETRTKLVTLGRCTMSQDAFVRFLIAGPFGDLAATMEEAPTVDST